MRFGITQRLFLSILATTCAAVIAMFLIMQWSLDRGFLRYVNTMDQERLGKLVVKLESTYGAEKGWESLKKHPNHWLQLLASTLPDWDTNQLERKRIEKLVDNAINNGMFPPQQPLTPRLASRFEMRMILLDANGMTIYAPTGITGDIDWRTIHYNGAVVGRVGLRLRNHLLEVHQLQFIREQKLALGLVALVVLVLAAGGSLHLAYRLVRPVKAMVEATHRLTAGRFDSRVPAASDDELGRLARDFNELASTLEKNELSRRQWVADISHELRTPLTVLRGRIEALQDNIHQPTPATINALHNEVMRLSRLVEDLHQLALSDVGALTYQKEPLNLVSVLAQVVGQYRAAFMHKGIHLETDFKNDRCTFIGDRERLEQLFTNLLDNALKYTDTAGSLRVIQQCSGTTLSIDFQDSAPGVPEDQQQRLFERLYRVEGSRNRSTGGAGLGLAICRNIVEAHGGTITAATSPLGGLWIAIQLPLRG